MHGVGYGKRIAVLFVVLACCGCCTVVGVMLSPAVTKYVSGVVPLAWIHALCVLLMVGLVVCQGRSILRYRVEEEVSVGTVVGDIVRDSRLNKKYPSDILQQLRFGFLTTDVGQNFTIGKTTGVIQTSGRIDRDFSCPRRELCEITLDIAVQPVQYFQIIKVTLEILDINDNSPRFGEAEMILPILESATPGSSFVLPTASDLDSPIFGVRRYELDSEGDMFRAKVTEKLDGAFDVRLDVNRPLDRETQNQYKVRLIAFDGGLPPNSGAMDIVIPILDSNDNNPVFDNKTYEVSILESIAVGASVVRVHATDMDIGPNGKVVYEFSSQTQSVYGKLLGVNNETGDVYIKGAIDREKMSVCNLIVTAHDLGPDAMPTDATVIIRVRDVNDNKPQITVNTLASSTLGVAEISEDAVVGTFVAHVSVVDPDDGANGAFNCTLSDKTFMLQPTYDTEYQILTSRPLDREKVSQYGLELVCRDHGRHQPQVAIKRLTVNVIDVNDNGPTFSQPTYSASMIENNRVEIGVLQVIATDLDMGKNARIRYSLSHHVDDVFQIDQRTGAIEAKISVDREQHAQFHFYVIATDQGSPPKSSSALIMVNVEDINDEVPEFVEPSYSFRVSENEPSRTEVGHVTAIDRDSPPANQFMYTFLRSKSPSDAFYLNTKTGRITTREPLDREKTPVYFLVVGTKDQGTPPLSSSASVTVYVTDKNDNAPRFDFPSPKNNTLHVSNHIPLGHVIAHVSAHDPDLDGNARLTYILDRGNEQGTFTLDPSSGAVSVNIHLLDVDFDVYTLTIRAEDHGSPSQYQTMDLNLIINSTIPFPPGGPASHEGRVYNYNVIVVVSVACGGAVITVSLIVAILLVRHNGRNRRIHKYNCRMEALRMLTTKDTANMCTSEESTPVRNGPKNPPVVGGSHGHLEGQGTPTRRLHDPRGMADGSQGTSAQVHARPWLVQAGVPHRDMGVPHRDMGVPHRDMELQVMGSSRAQPSVAMASASASGAHASGSGADHLDNGSVHSGDGSNTDSGRGPSEEGMNKGNAMPRRDASSCHGNHPGITSIPPRPGSHGAYPPPPPPPPNRLRTFSPDGSVPPPPQSSAHSTLSRSPQHRSVYPADAQNLYAKPIKLQPPPTSRHPPVPVAAAAASQPSNYANVQGNASKPLHDNNDDPWQRDEGAVVGHSVIV